MISIQVQPAAEMQMPLPNYSFTEAELVGGIQKKCEVKFKLLYKMYSPALMGIIFRIVKSESASEDVLQETFMKIWNSISGYDSSRGRLFTWMAATARNSAIDHVRAKAQINAGKNIDIDNYAVELENSCKLSYNPDIIGLKQLTFLLQPSEKVILDMIYFYGFSHSEAAEELGIPLGTVKTRLRRAIFFLRKYF